MVKAFVQEARLNDDGPLGIASSSATGGSAEVEFCRFERAQWLASRMADFWEAGRQRVLDEVTHELVALHTSRSISL